MLLPLLSLVILLLLLFLHVVDGDEQYNSIDISIITRHVQDALAMKSISVQKPNESIRKYLLERSMAAHKERLLKCAAAALHCFRTHKIHDFVTSL